MHVYVPGDGLVYTVHRIYIHKFNLHMYYIGSHYLVYIPRKCALYTVFQVIRIRFIELLLCARFSLFS